jgi:hypothetical protein
VRFLEYYDIPGITVDRRFFAAQKLATAKKVKIDHPNCWTHEYVKCRSFILSF